MEVAKAPNLMGAPAAMVLPAHLLPRNFNEVAQGVANRLDAAVTRREELLENLSMMTNTERNALPMQADFSLARKAHLDDVDWRVTRLMFCKDPKYNMGLDPALAYEVQQKKATDGAELERQLAAEAYASWAERLQPVSKLPPPEEKVVRAGIPFVQANPSYMVEDDMWGKRLDLRTMDEAMRGDIAKPLPRPVMFSEDHENFRNGKYVKDDCPIS